MSKARANRAKGNGNTNSKRAIPLVVSQFKNNKNLKSVQVNQSINWFFTFNNYEPDDILKIEPKFRDICIRYVFQEEKGNCSIDEHLHTESCFKSNCITCNKIEHQHTDKYKCTGTPHLQGSIVLKKKMRWSEFNLPKGIHWEGTRNIIKADAYCEKLDTRNGKIYKWGFDREKNYLSLDLYPWQQSIFNITDTEPDDRSIIWVYDKNGKNGKTRFCKFIKHKANAIIITGGGLKDIAQVIAGEVDDGGRNMDNLTSIIFNFARTTENISYQAIEALKDGLITSTKYHSKGFDFNCPHVFIFSNSKPDINRLTMDRWKIYTINESKELINFDIENIDFDE